MSNRLDTSELLDIARKTLLEKLLPALPEELHYEALMVANALANAYREQQLGPHTADDERKHLNQLTGVNAELTENRRLLAQGIRTGRYDADDASRARLLELLQWLTRRKLAISNPKRLARES